MAKMRKLAMTWEQGRIMVTNVEQNREGYSPRDLKRLDEMADDMLVQLEGYADVIFELHKTARSFSRHHAGQVKLIQDVEDDTTREIARLDDEVGGRPYLYHISEQDWGWLKDQIQPGNAKMSGDRESRKVYLEIVAIIEAAPKVTVEPVPELPEPSHEPKSEIDQAVEDTVNKQLAAAAAE